MSTPDLAPDQLERLALYTEETGEALQAVGKIQRHGYPASNPYAADPTRNNRGDLERELGDQLAAIELLIASGDVDGKAIQRHKEKKLRSVGTWVHYNKRLVARVVAALYGGLLLGCAEPGLVRHPDGTFEDVGERRCYRYVAAGVHAAFVPVDCPEAPP